MYQAQRFPSFEKLQEWLAQNSASIADVSIAIDRHNALVADIIIVYREI